MTTYYVGPGGNDGNAGTSWALRKLTLNGAEDIPVVAGDLVIVGPGTYRETLTLDVSGGAGNHIVYEGDPSGYRTDGIGGFVRITGSDNDQTLTRAACVAASAAARNYRTFRNFVFDMATTGLINASLAASTHWIVEDCAFMYGADVGINVIGGNGVPFSDWEIRRNYFSGQVNEDIYLYNLFAGTGTYNPDNLIENNVFWMGGWYNVMLYGGQTSTIRNNSIAGHYVGTNPTGIRTQTSAANPNHCYVYNNAVTGKGYALNLAAADVYDYNYLWHYSLVSGGVDGGNNVKNGSANLSMAVPIVIKGHIVPFPLFGIAPDLITTFAQTTDASAPTDDFFGMTRPVTAGMRSAGAIQWPSAGTKETTTVYAGTGSLPLDEAGRHQMVIPITGAEIEVSGYVYREANYAGSNPQIRILQVGQAAIELTDAGAAGAWNQLTNTFTPAALPGWIVLELVSRNTAAAGNYRVFFDNISVRET